jgi:hypothetical protein
MCKILNADETGITTVQNPAKILAEKGQKTVSFITSAERGQTTTIIPIYNLVLWQCNCNYEAWGLWFWQ